MCENCSCGATAAVSEEHLLEHLDGVLEEYRGKPGALIPVLQTAQTMFGFLPQAALRKIATVLDKPFSERTLLDKIAGLSTAHPPPPAP